MAAAGGVLALAGAGCQYTVRSSVSSTGEQGNQGGEYPALSSDGRFAAFDSVSSNLVAGDTNGVTDVFVRDHQTGATSRVSVSSAGTQGDKGSYASAISADGRYVTFTSFASDLVAGDTNASQDVFVHDRQSGATTRESVASDGAQGNGTSSMSAISADGRYVAFQAVASNLVAGDTNGLWDIFVRDRQTSTTTRASVSTAGVEGDDGASSVAISGDGAVVAFMSFSDNLVAGDTNGVHDVFVRDRADGTTTRVSLSSGGAQGNGPTGWPDLNADGTVVAFYSEATNLVAGDTNGVTDAFVRDRTDGTTTRVSLSSGGVQGNQPSYPPQISANARFVAFVSYASNLVPGDTNGITDLFVRDRVQGRTTRASTDSFGGQASLWPQSMALSGDGRYVAFTTIAPLDPADTNGVGDVYLKFAGEPKPKSITPSSQMPGKSVDVTIDGSGFEAGDQVGLSGGGVNVTNVQVVDDRKITATFEILPGASTGARWVAVSRSAGGWNSALGAVGSCVGCFTVSS